MSVTRAEEVTLEVERTWMSPSGWNRRSPAVPHYAEAWRAMFEAIRHVTGSHVIVDSSKSMGATALRLPALEKALDSPIATIQLVRDPRAVLYSIARRRGPSGEGSRAHPKMAVLKSSLTWSIANLLAERHRRRMAGGALVRYEDLTKSTAGTLDGLLSTLGLTPTTPLKPEGPVVLRRGHGIRGNRARSGDDLELRFDDRWMRARVGVLHRAAATATSPVAIRYGYKPWRTAPTG